MAVSTVPAVLLILLMYSTVNLAGEATENNQNLNDSLDDTHGRQTKLVSIGVISGTAAVVFCVLVAICIIRRRRKEGKRNQDIDLLPSKFHAAPSEEREIPEINYRTLVYVHNLGIGSFANVDKKILQNSRTSDYLFIADKYAKAGQQTFYEILLKEKAIMARMPLHVNLLKLLAVAMDDEGKEHLILEYCGHGSLYETVHKSHIRDASLSDAIDTDGYGLTRYHLYFIAYQIIDGMNFLSKHKLVHRDLALRNVLLATELLVKISGVGLPEEDLLPVEIAPEIRQKLQKHLDPVFTTKSDVYSLGILLWLLFDLSVSNTKKLLLSAARGVPIRRPSYACDKIFTLIKSCLETNPESRPDFNECLDQIISAGNEQSETLIERIKENVLKYGNRSLQDENGIY